MNEPTIICPPCKTEIKLTESLAAPLLESTRQEYEKRLVQKDADVAKRKEQVVSWKGGGGFRYYHLAPPLLEKDKWGNWVINKAYNPAMLTQAVCKLEGFTYASSDTVYWQQGYSTERNFIYITTQNLSHDQLQALSDEVGEEHSLLVMCSAFRGKPDKYSDLTVKKIPKTVFSRCEWGHDDYSLKIENLPKAPTSPGQQGLGFT